MKSKKTNESYKLSAAEIIKNKIEERIKVNILINKIDNAEISDNVRKIVKSDKSDLYKNVNRDTLIEKAVRRNLNYDEIINSIFFFSIRNSYTSGIESKINDLIYDIFMLSKSDFDIFKNEIKKNEIIYDLFLKVINKYNIQFNFIDTKITKENMLFAVENYLLKELKSLNFNNQHNLLQSFFIKYFDLLKSLNEEVLEKLETIMKNNHLVWNIYYYNVKMSDGIPKKFTTQESPITQKDIDYLMQERAYKYKADNFEITRENIHKIEMVYDKGKRKIQIAGTKQSKVKVEKDFYDYAKMVISWFDFKSHFGKVRKFVLNKFYKLNYKIGKILFLANMDKEQRDIVKKLDFDYRNIDKSSAIVKYIIRKNPRVFNDLNKKNKSAENNRLLFE